MPSAKVIPFSCTHLLLSQDLMYVSGFSDADEKQPTHTHNRTLRQNSPFSALYVSKDLSLFFFIYCLYYFLQLQTSNAVFPKRTLFFQLRMMLLKPGLATSIWKLGQKGFTSRFLHGIKQCPSVTLLCLSFFS